MYIYILKIKETETMNYKESKKRVYRRVWRGLRKKNSATISNNFLKIVDSVNGCNLITTV